MKLTEGYFDRVGDKYGYGLVDQELVAFQGEPFIWEEWPGYDIYAVTAVKRNGDRYFLTWDISPGDVIDNDHPFVRATFQ